MEWREFGNIELSYNYLKKVIESVNFKKNDLKILDIGTNMGSLPYLFNTKLNIYMEGVDVEEDAIECGKNKYKEIEEKLFVVNNDLDSIESNRYDVVTMFDVIEHIPNIEPYLKDNIMRILKPGGIFVFQTPNARINPVFETIQSKSFTRWKKWHCSLQTPKSLKELLINAGFKDIIIEKYRIDSEYNRKKLHKICGPLSSILISIFQNMPMCIYPNLWGYARKM